MPSIGFKIRQHLSVSRIHILHWSRPWEICKLISFFGILELGGLYSMIPKSSYAFFGFKNNGIKALLQYVLASKATRSSPNVRLPFLHCSNSPSSSLQRVLGYDFQQYWDEKHMELILRGKNWSLLGLINVTQDVHNKQIVFIILIIFHIVYSEVYVRPFYFSILHLSTSYQMINILLFD